MPSWAWANVTRVGKESCATVTCAKTWEKCVCGAYGEVFCLCEEWSQSDGQTASLLAEWRRGVSGFQPGAVSQVSSAVAWNKMEMGQARQRTVCETCCEMGWIKSRRTGAQHVPIMSWAVSPWATRTHVRVKNVVKCGTPTRLRKMCVRRGVLSSLSSHSVACTTFADVCTRNLWIKSMWLERVCSHCSFHQSCLCHCSWCGSCHFAESHHCQCRVSHQVAEDEEDDACEVVYLSIVQTSPVQVCFKLCIQWSLSKSSTSRNVEVVHLLGGHSKWSSWKFEVIWYSHLPRVLSVFIPWYKHVLVSISFFRSSNKVMLNSTCIRIQTCGSSTREGARKYTDGSVYVPQRKCLHGFLPLNPEGLSPHRLQYL